MPSRTKAEIIASCFAAYRAKDRTMIEELLTDDFTFTSPWDDNIDKAAYFAKCWPNCERQRSEAHIRFTPLLEGNGDQDV